MPTGFRITGQFDAMHYNTTIAFQWDPPQGTGPEAIVDSYDILITPTPLSHPSFNLLMSTAWNVTLSYNVEYTIYISAVNCAGESSPAILPNIEFSEYDHGFTNIS